MVRFFATFLLGIAILLLGILVQNAAGMPEKIPAAERQQQKQQLNQQQLESAQENTRGGRAEASLESSDDDAEGNMMERLFVSNGLPEEEMYKVGQILSKLRSELRNRVAKEMAQTKMLLLAEDAQLPKGQGMLKSAANDEGMGGLQSGLQSGTGLQSGIQTGSGLLQSGLQSGILQSGLQSGLQSVITEARTGWERLVGGLLGGGGGGNGPNNKMLEQVDEENEVVQNEDGHEKEQEKQEKEELFEQAPRMAELNKDIGHLLYQGDMALTMAQADHLLRYSGGGRARRQAMSAANFPTSLWPERRVPYTFHGSITQKHRQLIRQALDFWADNTCLEFQELKGEEAEGAQPKLQFLRGQGCYSSVGRVADWDNQPVSIGEGCQHMGIVAHEVAHSLGFFHTQSRWDRDQHVELNWANIAPGYEDQFNKEPPEINDNQAVAYDLGSVMHYAESAFSVNPAQPVLVANEPHNQNTMGQRMAPAFLDVLLMNKRYGCLADCDANTAAAARCQNGGFPRPKACAQCICPWGFGGPVCADRQPSRGHNAKSCGATVQAAPEWRLLKGRVGELRKVLHSEPSSCHWHIRAPAGKRLALRVVGLKGVCSSGCFYANVELKLREDMAKTGIRICCSADLPEQGLLLESEDSLAVVSLYTRLYAQAVELEYRYV